MLARLRNPWRRPYFLFAFTIGYLLWSLAPLLMVALFSFNNGMSRSTWQGFSWQWYFGSPGESLFRSSELRTALAQTVRLGVLTTLIVMPIGVAFAIGVDRWRGRSAAARTIRQGSNLFMLLAFVAPEIIFGVAFFLAVAKLLRFMNFGTSSEVLGLVTINLALPVVIVRARLLSIGRQYEEIAMDLGASPSQAIRRVLLPLLFPAIVVSAALVLARVFGDLVVVSYLSGDANSQPLAIKIYGGFRGSPSPVYNALATVMAVMAFLVAAAGLLLFRWTNSRSRAGSSATFWRLHLRDLP